MGEQTDRFVHADTLRGPPGSVRLVEPLAAGDERYRTESVLGQGGMGVVSVQLDRRIGRRVAAKALRPELAADGDVRARFLREAQVQGQLEHPAVVPVYDISTPEDGPPSFTMKTVQGVNLKEIITDLRSGDDEVTRKYSRHRLLSALANVCLAVDYAHQRGILHRDLKPANLMLGDWGEVYVLDWGVAKIQSAPELRDQPAGEAALAEAMTHQGSVLGTPGYMAPEQVDDPAGVGPAGDVYSLGAILFEVLALEPLHARGSLRQLFESTRRGADARASLRAPEREVPPELDALCVKATALDAAARYPSARELHDGIQRFLEGQRDLELRHQTAAGHARAAAAAAREARAGKLDARRVAMQEIGRALALDPSNLAAVGTMVELLAQPPEVTPPEVEFEMEKEFRRQSRWIGGIGALVYGGVTGFLPLLLWMGVRQTWPVAAFFTLLALSACLSILVWRSKVQPVGAIVAALIVSCCAFAFTSRFGSPLVITPVALAVNTAGYAIFLERRYRPLVALVSVLAFVVPFALEIFGVLPPTLEFSGGGLVIHPTALELPRVATLCLLVGAPAVAILLCTMVVGHIRDRLAAAERRMYLYTWHLREFVPPGARQATDPTT